MVARPQRAKPKRRATSVGRLAADINPLARRLVKLREEAKALGILTNERELLACDKCGLKEDVGVYGKLFTHFGDYTKGDTGLRFLETKKERLFRCPSCSAKIAEPEEAP